MSLFLINAANKLTKARKKIVECTLNTILDAFHVRKPKNSFKLEPKNLMMTAFYGYSMMFYEIISNVKHWVTWSLFDELERASTASVAGQERNFRSEIQSALYTAPNSDYETSHRTILDQYEQIETDKLSKILIQEALNARNALEKADRRAKSDKKKEEEKSRIAAITNPDELLEIETEKQEAKKRAKRCFDESASDSDSASSLDSEDSKNIATGKVKKWNSSKTGRNKKKNKGSNKRIANDTTNDKSSEVSINDDNKNSIGENYLPVETIVIEQAAEKIKDDLPTTVHSPAISKAGNFKTSHEKKQQPDDFVFSGVAHDSSLLHEADIGSDIDSNQDDEEEFDFENPGKLFSSSTKSIILQPSSNNKSSSNVHNKNTGGKVRTVNPEKLKNKQEAEKLHQESKEMKLESAKKKREECKNDRRVELANIFDICSTPAVDGESAGKLKKKRSCPISSDTVQHYVSDLNLKIRTAWSTTQTADLIANAVNDVVGTAATAAGVSSISINDHPNFDTLSAAEKMCVVDRNFKDGLMMYCQAELFKDVTFERLIVNYCIAKREISGLLCS
jgi:hypothetical protein